MPFPLPLPLLLRLLLLLLLLLVAVVVVVVNRIDCIKNYSFVDAPSPNLLVPPVHLGIDLENPSHLTYLLLYDTSSQL